MVDAIILAGGEFKADGQSSEGKPKAFIKLKDKPLIDWAIGALETCNLVNNIIVASLPKGTGKVANYPSFEDQGDLVENVNSAIDKATTEKVLLVASDIPLITAQVIEQYVKLCLDKDREADFYYPLVPKEAMAKFGQMKRTYFKLNGKLYTGGNIIMISRSLFKKHKALAKRIFLNRKNPLKIVQLFGPYFLFKFALGRLTIKDAEKKASDVFKAKAVAVVTPLPEIGSDIDKQSDLELVKDYLENSR